MIKLLIRLLVLLLPFGAAAQNKALRVLPVAAAAGRPLVFYIGGDGGWNPFSQALCFSLTKAGYPVVALDARLYFWKKQSPEQSTADISAWIRHFAGAWRTQRIWLVGYSFGADVLPFVLNRMDPALRAQVGKMSLVAPSPSTDFEVKLAGMLGFGSTGKYDVHRELMQVPNLPVQVIVSSDEKEDTSWRSAAGKVPVHIFPGGHHFEGNTGALAKQIIVQAARK